MSEESQARLEQMRKKLRKPTPEEAATKEERSAAAQPELLSLVRRIADGDGDRFALTHDLYRKAMTVIGPGGPNGEKAYVLYRVWTEFDDVGSYLGLRTPRVEEAMETAAREWLAIHDSDSAAWRAYHDRWLEQIGPLIQSHKQ